MAFLRLIENRLKLINTILVEVKPLKSINRMDALFLSGKVDPKVFLDGIGAFAFKGKSRLQFATPSCTTETTLNRLKSRKKLTKAMANRQISFPNVRSSALRPLSDSQHIAKLQMAYTNLEQAAILINASYSMQLIVIFIIKFTTLTSLLYFCCMMIIK